MTDNSSPQIVLSLLMGLPASGKSSLVHKITSSINDNSTKIPLVYDEFVPHSVQAVAAIEALSLQNQDNPQVPNNGNSMTKALRKNFILAVKILICYAKIEPEPTEIVPEEFQLKLQSLKQLINSRSTNASLIFIIDDNHYYSSMRGELFQLAKQFSVGFCIIYVQTSLKTCRQRNSTRSQETQVPDRTIVEMSLKFEEPDALKNSCDAYCLQIDGEALDQANIELILKVLENAAQNPLEVPPAPKDRSDDRRICSENEIHQADQILRKWVNTEIALKSFSASSSVSKKELSQQINRKRTETLEKLRNGELQIVASVDQELEFRQEILDFVNKVL